MASKEVYNLSVGEIEAQFRTDPVSGLTGSEVSERLAREGYNEFRKVKHKSLLVKFLNQFKSFLIIVLLVAAAISGFVGYRNGEGFTDAIIILIIVIINAVIGVAQEAKAEKSLDALEKLSSPHSKVIRDGKLQVIDSRELVPGDVVSLETGDAVPADIRLTEAVNLKIQEASLTGESVPEEKFTKPIAGEVPLGDRDNMAFASTSVTYGRGKGVVTATGMNSEVGKIASMIQSVPEVKTPMQVRLDKLGQILAIAALAICALIFVVGILYGRDWIEMFMIAVSLAVAAIPEGLPAVSTIVLAVGVQRLVKKHAIVRKLPSVETLGSTRVICSDKTGTLTQNRMTVMKVYVDGHARDVSGADHRVTDDEKELLRMAILANDATLGSSDDGAVTSIGDPTETAIVDLGLKLGLNKDALESEAPRVAEIPFDSERKMMTTVHKYHGSLYVYTKGGLDELLSGCTQILDGGQPRALTAADHKRIATANTVMAEKALRVLAVALKQLDSIPDRVHPETVEKDLVFVGLIGMIDPPREEAKVAVETCRTAGIKPVMITGDHRVTAEAIADSLGIKTPADEALTGLDLEKITDDELRSRVDHVAVYARVSPEHKVRIVRAFQQRGEVVAMTGDGVNDAPALKLADIGVAMGKVGTDVAKEAADIVLTDDNFATIVTAVEEGRRIYDNILKAVQFLLSTNIGEILVLLVAVVFDWATPLLPIHILWINLVTDSLPALALSVDPAEPDVMRRRPIDPKQGIITRGFSVRILLQGMMVAVLSLTAYHIGLRESVELAQSMTFTVLAFTQLTMVFTIRAGNHTMFRGLFNNRYLLGSIAIVFGLMMVVIEVPHLHRIFHLAHIDGIHWFWIAILSLAPIPITEIGKLIRNRIQRR